MKLRIERPLAEVMREAFTQRAPLAEQLCFGERVELPFDRLDAHGPPSSATRTAARACAR